jgi:hypothetical protein
MRACRSRSRIRASNEPSAVKSARTAKHARPGWQGHAATGHMFGPGWRTRGVSSTDRPGRGLEVEDVGRSGVAQSGQHSRSSRPPSPAPATGYSTWRIGPGDTEAPFSAGGGPGGRRPRALECSARPVSRAAWRTPPRPRLGSQTRRPMTWTVWPKTLRSVPRELGGAGRSLDRAIVAGTQAWQSRWRACVGGSPGPGRPRSQARRKTSTRSGQAAPPGHPDRFAPCGIAPARARAPRLVQQLA